MTVLASVVVSGPYVPDGTTRTWDFDFKVTSADQLVIVLVDPAGVETEVTSGFTVPALDLNSDAGGTLTYPVSPTAALLFADYEEVYVIRRVALGQPNQIGNQGGFYPETHEGTFDLLAMQIQQLNERMDRAAVVPISAGVGDLAGIISDILLLADLDAELTALGAITANITTAAGISADITTVAGVAAAISTLSPISANITTAAGISADITTVAGIAANVTAVAPISANITTVAGIAANVTAVAGIAANVTAVAANETNINAAVADLPSLAAKANDASVVKHDTVQTLTTAQQAQAQVNIGALQHGQCRLDLVSGDLALNRYNGKYLIINGTPEEIPASSPSLAVTGLTPGTLYFIYAYMSGATMLLEASTTARTTHTDGVEIKTGDSTRTLVGAAVPSSGPIFKSSGASMLVRSWFNRNMPVAYAEAIGGITTSSTSWTVITSALDLETLLWAGEMWVTHFHTSSYHTTNNVSYTGVSFNGATPSSAVQSLIQNTLYQTQVTEAVATASSDGYIYSRAYGYVDTVGALVTVRSRVFAEITGA